MPLSVELNNQHQEVTRRYFIQLGAAGALAFKIHSVQAEANQSILDSAMADMSYLCWALMDPLHPGASAGTPQNRRLWRLAAGGAARRGRRRRGTVLPRGRRGCAAR